MIALPLTRDCFSLQHYDHFVFVCAQSLLLSPSLIYCVPASSARRGVTLEAAVHRIINLLHTVLQSITVLIDWRPLIGSPDGAFFCEVNWLNGHTGRNLKAVKKKQKTKPTDRSRTALLHVLRVAGVRLCVCGGWGGGGGE